MSEPGSHERMVEVQADLLNSELRQLVRAAQKLRRIEITTLERLHFAQAMVEVALRRLDEAAGEDGPL